MLFSSSIGGLFGGYLFLFDVENILKIIAMSLLHLLTASNQLSGRIPTELGDLSALTALDICKCLSRHRASTNDRLDTKRLFSHVSFDHFPTLF